MKNDGINGTFWQSYVFFSIHTAVGIVKTFTWATSMTTIAILRGSERTRIARTNICLFTVIAL